MNQQDFINAVFKRNTTCFKGFPDKQIAEDFIDELFFFLFGAHEKKLGQDKLQQQYEGIKSTFAALLYELIKNEEQVKQHTTSLFAAIPSIYQHLLLDA
ncbi:MAG: serine acetyltransferase, partial [Segetibacter sp.]